MQFSQTMQLGCGMTSIFLVYILKLSLSVDYNGAWTCRRWLSVSNWLGL